MIDLQGELPVQKDSVAAVWARGRRVISSTAKTVRSRIGALPVEQFRGIGLFARLQPTRNALLRERLARLSRGAKILYGDGPLLNRLALHLVVIFLAAGVVAISQLGLPDVDLRLPTPAPAPDTGARIETTSSSNRGANRLVSNDAGLFPVPVPHTTIAERETTKVFTYTVQSNDNIWAIAQSFGLQAQTILWANPLVEQAPDLLSVGQVLVILPVDGIYHTVQPGDTVDKLAKKYESSVEEITSYPANQLEEPFTLTAGQQLIIPGGIKPIPKEYNIYPMTWVGTPPKDALQGSGRFAWPARGVLTQRYWSAHLAIDIGNRQGTPIYAADAGYVRLAGRDTWGYGNQVVIDHGNGFVTRYAHLHTILVKAGQSVTKNQQIGTMGNTGRSTGPHLHFEVIQNGVKRNPLGYLP